jgi:hypothetical protein
MNAFKGYNLGLPRFGRPESPGIFSGVFGNQPYIPGYTGYKPFDINVSQMAGWKSWLAYFLAITITILVILIFVHFLITPVFNLHPGGPGYITIPGFDDGTLYWKNTTSDLENNTLPIVSTSKDYTFICDILIKEPTSFSNKPRIIFARSNSAINANGSDRFIKNYLSNYNFAIALSADTNDIIVSILDSNNNEKSVVVSNPPVRKAFRIGVVIADRLLEVYVNGKLLKALSLTNTPKEVNEKIKAPTSDISQIVEVKNLKIWNRILTPTEIRESKPELVSDGLELSLPSIVSSNICTNTSDISGNSDI